jgi:hypothetical protein
MTAVILPLALLALAGWAVPWTLARLMPEGPRWLAVNAVASLAALAAVAVAIFVLLYGEAGWPALVAAPGHFATLAARSALVWAPIAVLTLANEPRGWQEAEW